MTSYCRPLGVVVTPGRLPFSSSHWMFVLPVLPAIGSAGLASNRVSMAGRSFLKDSSVMT